MNPTDDFLSTATEGDNFLRVRHCFNVPSANDEVADSLFFVQDLLGSAQSLLGYINERLGEFYQHCADMLGRMICPGFSWR